MGSMDDLEVRLSRVRAERTRLQQARMQAEARRDLAQQSRDHALQALKALGYPTMEDAVARVAVLTSQISDKVERAEQALERIPL